MKRYIIILSMIFGLISFVNAQPKTPTAVELATKSITAMEKKVKLNPTQRSIIYNYTLDMYTQQLELSKKQQAGNGSEDDTAKFYKLQNQTVQNIRNLLKGDQQTDYDAFLEEQLRGGDKKKKKGKHSKDDDDEVVTGISGLKLPAGTPPANQ
ncbi:hypothetical protein [Pedobacter sp. L105]|uniref:hypothetical protein n=1 Tax=Pedobacter sp. L105 TaxID=1641871 RepID=UPI00131A60A2|nr:hypothetical protein [Pedobacter sp. L105]